MYINLMARKKLWIHGLIIVVVGLIAWILFISSKQIERSRRIQAEVSGLEVEAAKIRRENETLSEKISYFASSDFREQEAKKKLGLKKAEETVAVIKPAPEYTAEDMAGMGPELGGERSMTREESPNYKKWWKIFF